MKMVKWAIKVFYDVNYQMIIWQYIKNLTSKYKNEVKLSKNCISIKLKQMLNMNKVNLLFIEVKLLK